MFNAAEHMKNRANHSLEELKSLEGQFVAWSLDGNRILAHGATWDELLAETDRLGLAGDKYVAGGVGLPDEVQLGGSAL